MPLPPRWLRRLVLAPGVVLLAFFVVTTLPAWALLALAASPLVPGRLRPLRLLWFGTVYLVWDAAALLALFLLWLASGFGVYKRAPAFQRAHYVLAGWFLRVMFWQARWTLRLSIDVVGTDPDTALPGRPELVVCRHAGPGDSFILIHALVNWFNREPRIVLKETLQWDPAIDVLHSVSRVMNQIVDDDQRHAAGRLREWLAKYEEVELLLKIGEYQKGQDSEADQAIEKIGAIRQWLRQGTHETSDYAQACAQLRSLCA